ncbi:hypothetical protein BD413DRAFT_34110 [Trametes elegans]|nr:hypothetical protein BD413DRAFT_34110 [Trametes elegans]
MARSDIEGAYGANLGVEDVIEAQHGFALKHNASFGEFIQFSGAVSLSNCVGAPCIQFLAGRSNDSQAAPEGFSADETVNLLTVLPHRSTLTPMTTKFQTVMAKIALVGQDASSLTDCSEVISQPKAALANVATLPMGKTLDDIEASCAETPFTSLSADPGPETSVVAV